MEQDAVPAGRRPNLDAFVLGVFATVVAFMFGSSPRIFSDGDVSWHVASGRWIIDHRMVPTVDPFSFTMPGHPWVAQEWLSDILSAAAMQAFGNSGLSMLVSLALALLLLIVGFEMRRWASPVQLGLSLLALCTLLVSFTLARPHVFAWPLLAGWIVMLLRAREHHRSPPLWMVALILFWANFHASYILGLLLTGFFALEALLVETDKRRTLAGWLLFGVLCLGAALLTPHGLAGLIYPFDVMRMTSLKIIGEWRASNVNATPEFGVALLAMLFALGWRGVRVPLLRLLLILVLLWLALSQMRQQPLWAIASILLLARPIADSLGDGKERPPFWQGAGVPANRIPAAWIAITALFVVLAIVRASLPISRPDTEAYPSVAIAHIPALLRRQPVLNTYSFGGPLIAAGIRPFIDGRSDMYGDAFTEEYQKVNTGDPAALDRATRRFRLVWAITETGNDPLLRLLDSTPGWHRIYADKDAVIHRRDIPLGTPLPLLAPSNGR
jgi:hypothetical protein